MCVVRDFSFCRSVGHVIGHGSSDLTGAIANGLSCPDHNLHVSALVLSRRGCLRREFVPGFLGRALADRRHVTRCRVQRRRQPPHDWVDRWLQLPGHDVCDQRRPPTPRQRRRLNCCPLRSGSDGPGRSVEPASQGGSRSVDIGYVAADRRFAHHHDIRTNDEECVRPAVAQSRLDAHRASMFAGRRRPSPNGSSALTGEG
ncbi:MAG: hypothetical protein JWN62_1342 [Acidimicrobiales bacterium]|nr:hypothetical protein [Acidimicrobiales bacterium]